LNNFQQLGLSIVLGYVLGEMVGLEKASCIYAACLTAIPPAFWIVCDIFKKNDNKPS
jgi:hypothetical protein